MVEWKRETPEPSPASEQLDPAAADSLFPLLYEELRRIAHRQLAGERPGHTLCTTPLVHEAYVKLSAQTSAQFASRAHFLAVAADGNRFFFTVTERVGDIWTMDLRELR